MAQGERSSTRWWRTNKVFRFVSSVKLAVILLAILIIASAVGTICESRFDAKVARAYVYEAPWFNAWLLLLAVNLAAAAFSRYPWKKHHTGFLITHAGIITLLIGAVIGRLWGIEGTMTLFVGDEPSNRLIIDQQEVRVRVGDQVEHFPIGISHRREHPKRSQELGRTSNGWKVEVTDYAAMLQAVSNAQPATGDEGHPALRIRMWNPAMGQQFEQWYWPDDPENSSLDLGMIAVHARRGTAGSAAFPAKQKISSKADPLAPTSNRATIYIGEDGALSYELSSPKAGGLRGKLKEGQPLSTGWADWQLQVIRFIPHAVPNTDFIPIPVATKLTAQEKTNVTEGVRIRFSNESESHEEWLASGWQVTLPAKSDRFEAAYGLKIHSLPIAIQLQHFEVERNEGNDSPAAFKSTLLVRDAIGNQGTGSCSMNEPMNFPASFWRVFTGMTYKISQASWNPENLKQSSIQILIDPGWLFKWVGSLMICLGIFTLFYLRPPRAAHS